MNIYVKNEEMPKSCRTCKFYSNFMGRCIFKFSVFPVPKFAYRTRQKFCPLKLLSETKEECEMIENTFISDICSKCNECIAFGSVQNFCPNCGAKVNKRN